MVGAIVQGDTGTKTMPAASLNTGTSGTPSRVGRHRDPQRLAACRSYVSVTCSLATRVRATIELKIQDLTSFTVDTRYDFSYQLPI